MKLGFGDDGLVIKDLNLMLKNGSTGELKARGCQVFCV